ncbi:MAG: LysR family transcriptional regulator [Hahellaceae bacterium]|nr:LysR family transcriptional regulator [Hahellaceae bacterium]
MLDRSHLLVVRTIEQQGSLTAAARQLCLTQSALSHTIRKLETHLGTAIWLREGRQLRLTPAGRYLLGLANRLLPQLEYAEARLRQFARGERGTLRIGMECHPCYQWLINVISPFLSAWPDVDVDVKQKFLFGGIGALLEHEIDLLVTPDPFNKAGLKFEPVFDFEQILVLSASHRLAGQFYLNAEDLRDEVLLTYPVSVDRLDIYTQFLTPAGIVPRLHKTCESTDVMLQLVSSGRGVAPFPAWLAETYQERLNLALVRLGQSGIHKQIFLGIRESDQALDYLRAFIDSARE